jgi:hypothetical protein
VACRLLAFSLSWCGIASDMTPEHPGAKQQEAKQGSRQIGQHEYRELDPTRRRRRYDMECGQAAAGEAETEGEHSEALRLMSRYARSAHHAERETTVGRRIADRGEQKCQQVRELSAQQVPQQEEAHEGTRPC